MPNHGDCHAAHWAEVRIGHVHLKVSDLERALRSYCGVLGFELTQKLGDQAAFVSAAVIITTSD